MRQVPRILPSESLTSYLHRLSSANNHLSGDIMAEELLMSVADLNNNEFSIESIKKIAEITEHDCNKLYSMSMLPYKNSLGTKTYDKLLFKNKAKYCPVCITNTLYYKTVWTLNPVMICLEHNMQLIEECQGCNRSLNMNSYMNGYCIWCSFEYKRAIAKKINPDSLLHRSQSDMLLQLNGERSKHCFFQQFTFADYLHLAEHSIYLLEGLASVMGNNRTIQGFYNKKGQYKSSVNGADLHANIFYMYDSFPYNFNQILDAFQTKEATIKYMQKPMFEELLNSPKFQVLRNYYESYWVKQSDLGNVRSVFSVFKRDPLLLEKRLWLTKEEAKNKYGITYRKLNTLSKLGEIQTKTIQKTKMNHYRIDKNQLMMATRRLKQCITYEDASVILGLQRNVIPSLISSGLLTLKQAPDGKDRLIRGEVMRLLKLCRGDRVQTLSSNTLAFHQAIKKYNHCGLSAALLIKYTMENVLKPVTCSAEGTLFDVNYDKDDLSLCLKKIKTERQRRDGYFMSELQEIFSLGEKTIWELVKYHILVPEKIITLKNGRKQYLFAKDKIDSFKRNNITIKEASIQFCVSEVTIRRWIARGRLKDEMRGLSRSQRINVNDLTRVQLN